MSLFRKKKEVDFIQQEKAIDKEIATSKKLADKARTEEEPALRVGEVRVRAIETDSTSVVSDETSRERYRMKFKDTSGLAASQDRNSYPTFNVFYLGRIPTSIEFGNEAVEGPVDQLCKLRDKQKLPKVAIAFDTEGLTVKEVTSSLFSKTKSKKDGIDLFIPLHHITYGVATESHPSVFACITRMVDDDTPLDGDLPVLMLHAFLCDKADTAQQITYWQLQAYIEAYEELKRKKILRNRRKQALGVRKSTQRSQAQQQPLPLYGSEPPPPMDVKPEENGNDLPSPPSPKKGYNVKNKGYIRPKPSNGHVLATESKDVDDEDPDSPDSPTRSDSIDDSQSESARDVAFGRRISEMNELMVEMDAEKLKKLMISNHASLARDIYFNKNNPNRKSTEANEDSDDGKDNSNV